MSDELTDLKARLEALAAKWAVPASDQCDYNYRAGLRQASKDLRALLAPVAAEVCSEGDALGAKHAEVIADTLQRIKDDLMLESLMCEKCRKNLKACHCAPSAPVPPKESPLCEECAHDCTFQRVTIYPCCGYGGVHEQRKLARDVLGRCGPTGRLFKRREG
jgi:hypothetical protein